MSPDIAYTVGHCPTVDMLAVTILHRLYGNRKSQGWRGIMRA